MEENQFRLLLKEITLLRQATEKLAIHFVYPIHHVGGGGTGRAVSTPGSTSTKEK